MPSPGLFIVLHTASGDRAMAGLDLPLVDHVVDIVTGGDPGTSDSLPPRTPTDLDAALCSMVIDVILRQLIHEIQALGGDAEPEPFVHGRREHVPGNLGHLLPEQQYLSIRATLDIAGNARTGHFYIGLPLSWIEPIEPALRRANPAAAQNDSAVWRHHMRSVVRRTPLTLTAVIDSFPMQVSDMAHLETGKLFPLPSISLDDVRLELDTGTEQQLIARGRLGVHKSKKAIKIIEPLGGAYFEALADALSGD
jgi:flagellar motor switch protein FliM